MPIIITKILKRIETLIIQQNIARSTIYELFNNNKDQIEFRKNTKFTEIITKINKGDLSYFINCENIYELKCLLLIWIEDCVEYVISPITTYNIIFDDVYKRYIDKQSKNKIQEDENVIELIKSSYQDFEFETLYFISQFLVNITPIGNKEDKLMMSMITNISILLLGFSPNEENPIVKSTITSYGIGLSSIINLIYNSLSIQDQSTNNAVITDRMKLKYNISDSFNIRGNNSNTNELRNNYINVEDIKT